MKIGVSESDAKGRIKPRLAVTVDEVPRLWVLQVAAREHSTVSAVVNRLLWAAYDEAARRRIAEAMMSPSAARPTRKR